MKKFGSSIKEALLRMPRWMKVCTLAAGLCALTAFVLYAVRVRLSLRLFDQQAAYTWSADGRGVSQISVFYPIGSRADANTIRALEYDLTQELKKISAQAEEEETTPFVSCMSTSGSVVIRSETGERSVTAHAIGTYGDFFRFHPLTLLSGSLYSEDLLTPDRILLDENLAWQLFGSFDITGCTVTIGGVAHTVAGVFSLPRDGLIRGQSAVPDDLCFLSLESLCQLGTLGDFTGLTYESKGTEEAGSEAADKTSSGSSRTQAASVSTGGSRTAASSAGTKTGSSAGGSGTSTRSQDAAVGTTKVFGITTWEAVMPDPVKNYAVNLVRTKVEADKEKTYVVENSSRFAPENLRKNLKGLFTRGMQTKPIVYPYWENIARGYTNLFTLLWVVQSALTVAACGIVFGLAVYAFRHRTWTLSGILKGLAEKKYDLESRLRYEREKWEHF